MIKRFLKHIWFWLSWSFILLLQGQRRLEYQHSKELGHDWKDGRDYLFFQLGTSDRNKTPVRRYITYPEYRDYFFRNKEELC